MMATWVVVGASPSGPKGLAAARVHWRDAVTITTNGGLRLFDPGYLDYYLLFDMVACSRYGELSKAYQARGTTLVTLARSDYSLKRRGVDHFDEFLELQRGGREFVRGGYADVGYSGLYCTMYAVNHGAHQVAWTGMEGYRSTPEQPVDDHFHGQLGPDKGARQTQNILGPFLQTVADGCPDVEFRFYGQPLFPLVGPNITIIPEN